MKQQTTLTLSDRTFDSFTGRQLDHIIGVTESQAEIWAACLLGGEDASRAYNESISLVLNGKLDANAMKTAFKKLTERHEVLRATFSKNGRFLCVFDAVSIDFKEIDLSSLSVEERDKETVFKVKEDVLHVFDLVQGPLFKISLLKTAIDEHHLLLTAHHIICDGWTLGIFLQELSVLYSAIVEHKISRLPDAVPFSVYADHLQEVTANEQYQEIEQFWLNQYKNDVPILQLPTDFSRPALRTYKSDRLDFQLEPKVLLALRQLGIEAGVSLVTTFITVFEIFLSRITGAPEIVLGLPAAGQSASGMEQLAGHCVNLLPLRSRVDNSLNFMEYIAKRKIEILDAYEHQELTFGHLLKKLHVARDPSRVPLVPVVLNIDMGLTNNVDFESLSFDLISNPREYETFELFLNISGSGKKVVFEWSYNTALFKPETIKDMMHSFEKVMTWVCNTPTLALKEMKLADYSAAYAELNATYSAYTAKSLHSLLAEQARSLPMNTAVRFENNVLTYKDLHRKANQLAHYLVKNGVRPNDTVGLVLPRSEMIPIALIAILQCGAHYLPIDPEYPKPRITFILEDSKAEFLLTQRNFAEQFPNFKNCILLEDALSNLQKYPETIVPVQTSPESLAYLLYTSGSTGKPKGVRVTHKNVVNLLSSVLKEPGITSEDNVLAITTISFDIAALEIFLPLLCGATLIMASEDARKDGRLILDLIHTEHISLLQATPSTLQMLLNAGWKKSLITPLKVISGGEQLSLSLANKILEKCDALWNMYGPTETTIYSSLRKVSKDDERITIGRPIANTKIFVLTDSGALAAPGSIGEIAIAGDGVAQGYWQRPELNVEKFVAATIGSETYSIYRTGDLGKLLPSTEIQFLGRMDQQLKIRGHRIEPGEVEHVLQKLASISAVAVASVNELLIAFIVPNDTFEISISSWREKLMAELPSYMMPQEFRILNELPTTANGKLDRSALAAMEQVNGDHEKIVTGPRTQGEEIIAAIWKELLQLDKVDIFSNFFELGGHSLIAVQIMSRLEEKTGKRLPLSSLFAHSTIEKLAQLLDEKSELIMWDSLVPIRTRGSKTPLFLVHGGDLNVLLFEVLAKNMDDDQPIYALQGKGLDGEQEPLGSVEEIAAYYIEEIKKVSSSGPYVLAGYSLGGIIVFEMAKQLMALGKEVKTLALLDTYAELRFLQKTKLRKNIANMRYFFEKELESYVSPVNAIKKLFCKANEFSQKFYKSLSQPKNLNEEKDELYDRLIKMNTVAINKYHLTPLPIKIELFRAEHKTYYMHDSEFLGWKQLALGGVNAHTIPGSHVDILSPPNDKTSAHILQNVLNTV